MGDYYENALRRTFHEEADRVEPAYMLPTILTGARRREAWLVALVVTVGVLGALLVAVGLVLLRGQDEPAAPTPASDPVPATRLLEA